MRKDSFKLISAFLLTSSLITFSCIDNDYDLAKDIDLTISIGGSEFAIPAGKTEPIELGKILELEENGVVKVDEVGNYFLEQTGSELNSDIKINAFSVPAPSFTSSPLRIEFNNPTNIVKDAGGQELTYTENDAKSEISFSAVIPQEIKSLDYIIPQSNLKANLKFSFSNSSLSKLTLKDLTIKFPAYIILGNGYPNNEIKIANASVYAGSNGYSLAIPITRIDCTKFDIGEGLNSETHILSAKNDITIRGTITANTNDINADSPSKIEINLNSQIDMVKMDIVSIAGVIKPNKVIEADPIKLSGIPDFLKDDDVRLDIKNPMIFFTIGNSSPLEANVKGTLKAYKKEESQPINEAVSFSVSPIQSFSANQNFCLSALEKTNLPVEDPTIYIHVPTLNKLINKIPDELRFDELKVDGTDKVAEVYLGRTYNMKTNYRIHIPFIFGPNLSIVYKDTIDGWMEDIKDYEVKQINATANAINKIPLALVFTAQPMTLNAKGESVALDGVEAKVKTNGSNTDNTIQTGTSEGKLTPLIIEITETKAGSIKKLDGLALKAIAKSSQTASDANQQLNTQQTLQLTDIRLKVPGGIKVDLN